MKLENQTSIGVSLRKTKINPGPGNYNPNFYNTVRNMPSYSLKSRAQKVKPATDVPGPGTYSS